MNFYVFSFDACRAFSVSFFRCHVFLCLHRMYVPFGEKKQKNAQPFFIACVFRRKQKNNE